MASTSSMAMPLITCTSLKKSTGFFTKPVPYPKGNISSSKFVVKASLKEKAAVAAAAVLSASLVVPADVAQAAADVVISPSLTQDLLLDISVLSAFVATVAGLYILDRNSKVDPVNILDRNSKVDPFYILERTSNVDPINRDSFPDDFIFGAGSSAYQVEGAWNEDGKGPSIWDTFAHKNPMHMIPDNENGDIALDFYHRYKEDIALAKSQGLDMFRISISWSRILPKGKLSGGINQPGIDFYNRVFDEMIAHGLKPCVTLFHWDTPQTLEDDYLGFLKKEIVDDFCDYADICFHHFGDRVKYWTTVNEPQTFSSTGYDYGIAAPGRCSNGCAAGNSDTEPYKVAHHLLLAHAAVNNLYKQKYKAKQQGQISIVLNSMWFEPFSKNIADVTASNRALDFMLGWFLHPVVYGDYPETMKRRIGSRLPPFTSEEKQSLRGSFDFIGINYYTSNYAGPDLKTSNEVSTSASTDDNVLKSAYRDGVLIGEATGSPYNFVVPWGLSKLLNHVRVHYTNPKVIVTECGMAGTFDESIKDIERVEFLRSHFLATIAALKFGANVKGFIVWAFEDNFEWWNGYSQRYGINHIDYSPYANLKRTPKESALWLKNFLLNNSSLVEEFPSQQESFTYIK